MVNFLLFNVHTINFWYAVAGLGLLVITGILIVDYFCNKQKLYLRFLSRYFWVLAIALTSGGLATTLFYSEVLGFVPCSLCWFQRIALYPQVLLAIIAFKLHDVKHFPVYGIVLSCFGFLVAVYHYIYQSMPQELRESGVVLCLTDGSADCADKIMEVFGFVTFPFLSGVLFLFLIVLFFHRLRENKETN